MKPGHTAARGALAMGKHGKPGKVGTAHNEDKGPQALVDQMMTQRARFGGSRVKSPSRAESDFLQRKSFSDQAQDLVLKIRQRHAAKGIKSSKFK